MEIETKIENKKVFSKVGLATVVSLIVVNVMQILFFCIIEAVDPELKNLEWMNYIALAISFYLIGFPTFYFMLKDLPNGKKYESKKLKVSKIISLFFISYSVIYITNIVTSLIIMVVGIIKGEAILNPLESLVEGNSWILTLLFVGVLSPIIEEVMFRGIMINKLRQYGDVIAIVTTGILFGLYHGNFSQFFYATALGFIFAYVTLKTGTIKYSIILHMAVNILGSVIGPLVIGNGSNLMTIGIFGIVIIMVVIIGIVLLIMNMKKISLLDGDIKMEKGDRVKSVWVNFGMLSYVIITLIFMIYGVIM